MMKIVDFKNINTRLKNTQIKTDHTGFNTVVNMTDTISQEQHGILVNEIWLYLNKCMVYIAGCCDCFSFDDRELSLSQLTLKLLLKSTNIKINFKKIIQMIETAHTL